MSSERDLSRWTVIGIDPAPSKAAIACMNGSEFVRVAAAELPAWVANILVEHEKVLIAWDAPLSFDPTNGYSDRPVDREVRAWVKAQGNMISSNTVSVLPFAGCPHWAISCAALGMPFGAKPGGLQLAATPDDGDKLVVEVHPAVSLARWWVAHVEDEPMPKYKGVSKPEMATAIDRIRTRLAHLEIPVGAAMDDDHLDAWVGWKMGEGFLNGDAEWIGTPEAGGYVVPALARSLRDR